MNYDYEQTRTRYHFWFNTYPLEFGEFLLDSALTMGSYLHPVCESFVMDNFTNSIEL